MVGRVFMGRYQATRLLGEGGMGRVYLAHQLDLGRQVVVKVMHEHVAADPEFRERFQRETLLMARFQHPYAVTLYDAALNDPEGSCIVMEYIRGVTLDALLKANGGRLTPARVGRFLGQLCEVLQVAHKEGIIHRDLKPANIMIVEPESPFEKIKVMDFGLAKLVNTPSLQDISLSSGGDFAVGTPAYICPEQVQAIEMDHRGDLYSVGVMLYEMLTGRLPFRGDETMDMLLSHATEKPPSFAEVGADWIPKAVEAVVFSCLEKDPNLRPNGALELAERFELAFSEEEPEPEPAPAAPTAVSKFPPNPAVADPNAVVHHMEAWMPESVAGFKIRGYVQDAGGEVLESVPGLIRVRLGGPGTRYRLKSGPFSWLSRKNGVIEVFLNMQQNDPERQSLLSISVTMRSLDGDSPANPYWCAYCNHIFCDMRGYLMAQTVGMGS